MTTVISNNNEKSSAKANKSSSLLSSDENDLILALLGRKCQTLCTAVCQLYQTETPNHSKWIKKYTGVLCFVKDNAKRSYYCRLYCLIRQELMWEQEMYDTIEITRPRPYLLSFEGQDGIIGLNFANEDEAEAFQHISVTTVANRNRRREERRRRGIKKEPPARPPPVNNTNNNNNNVTSNNITNNNYLDNTDASVTLRNAGNIAKIATPYPVQPNNNNNYNNKKDKKSNGPRKLTKADIGTPSNFKHITHVGWNAQSGFDLTGEDESLKPFLQKAGVSENQLKDRRTRDFIYDFIQNHNVAEVVKKEKTQKGTAPPPVPSRHQNQSQTSQSHQSTDSKQRLAPPPPPPPKERHERHEKHQAPAPPLPTTTPPIRGPPPTRPPPINLNSSSAAATVPSVPPPPPPPPSMSVPPPPPPNLNMMNNVEKPNQLPVVPDVRSALMESIRKGTQLKKVDQVSTTSNSSGDSRSELMSEIRQGVELRPTNRDSNSAGNRSSGGGTVGGTDALAEALRKALEKRSGALRAPSSDEDNDSESDNDGEWSD